MSARTRMLIGFAAANLIVLLVAVLVIWQRPPAPPRIQGVLLTEARPVGAFSLLDDRGREFDNGDLKGRWHLVTYGFTTCPDICPTTLSQLDAMLERLGNNQPEVLFYSVDHQRDTSAQLASYLGFFDDRFIGLTHLDDPRQRYLNFEQDLGIVARLIPGESGADGDYQVVHGVTLMLLNPRGELQAVFKPQPGDRGLPVFDPDRLAADYLAVRRYVES